MARITPTAQKLARALEQDGIALVLDGLNEARIIPLATAFESEGFTLQTKHMEPRTYVGEFVAISFSRTERAPGDGPLSASTLLSLNDKTLEVTNGAAESLRELFGRASSLLRRESIHEGVKLRVEILEYQGLVLFYETGNNGFRHAVLASSALAPILIRGVSDHFGK